MLTTTSLTLLEDVRRGGVRAWQEFFCRYGPMVLAVAKRLGLSDADAHDAVQETLLAVHRAFQEMGGPFDRSKGRFKSWLLSIVRHKVHDLRRRQGRQERAEEARAEQGREPDPESALGCVFEDEWQRNLLVRALQQLAAETDPVAYQAFDLYVVHEQPAERVAALLGLSRNAVYIVKTRVLRRLREIVQGLMEDEE